MTHDPFDTAVLLVHGIGEQTSGQTLAEFGGALVGTARELFGDDNVADVPSGAQDDDAAPQHRALIMTSPGAAPRRVLLAESLWAQEVRVPRWRTLMAWLSHTVLFVVQRAADAWMRRSSRQLDASRTRRTWRRLDPGVKRSSRRVLNAADVLLGGLLGALRVALNVVAVSQALVVLVLLFALGLLAGLAPVRQRLFGVETSAFPKPLLVGGAATIVAIGVTMPTVEPAVRFALATVAVLPVVVVLSVSRRLRTLVVGFIGDSYALLHEDGPHNAIVAKVRSDLAWLERHAGGAPVLVVAHSQGAEVARRALCMRTRDQPPIDGLVTFGSGIAKLHCVDRLRGQRRRSLGAFALRLLSAACAVLGAVALLGWWDGTLQRHEGVALLAMAALALTAARRELQRIVGVRLEPSALEIDAHQLAHWTDLHASHDLVSEGDLPVQERTRGFSRTVVNRRSLILDHVVYWENVEGFQAAIALEIERVVEGLSEPRRPPALERAERARTRRITVIYAIRFALSAIVVGLCASGDLTLAAGAGAAACALGLYLAVAAWLHARCAARTRALIDHIRVTPRTRPTMKI